MGISPLAIDLFPCEMKKIRHLFLIAVLAVVAFFLSVFIQETRKNVILITVDTLRADHLPFYGYERNTAPILSEFAQEALLAEHLYTTSTATGSAHASILTGQEVVRHGTLSNEYPFNPPGTSLQMALRSRGYLTAAFVSSVVVDSASGYSRGFDYYDDSFTRGTVQKNGDFTLKSAEHWITANKNENFLIWIHLADPYRPYVAPKGFRGKFTDETKTRHKGTLEELQGIDRHPETLSEEGKREIAGYYDEEILYTDSIIGEFLNYLKVMNLYGNTIVVITSDHGETLYEQRNERDKTLSDSLLRIPLLILNSGLPPQVVKDVFFNIDIYPTICSLLGIAPPVEVQGVSMVEKGQLAVPPANRSLVAVSEPMNGGQGGNALALLSFPWELVQFADGSSQLGNMRETMTEEQLQKETAVSASLTDTLNRWKEENRWSELRKLHPAPPERLEKLKKQGYLQ